VAGAVAALVAAEAAASAALVVVEALVAEAPEAAGKTNFACCSAQALQLC